MGFKSAVVRFIRSRFGASKDLGKMAFGRNSGIDNDIKEKYGFEGELLRLFAANQDSSQ